MLSDVYVSTETNRVLIGVLLAIALVTTATRICIRCRHRRLWWDDGWALLTTLPLMLVDFAYFAADVQQDPNTPKTRLIRIVQIWIIVVGYSFAVWHVAMLTEKARNLMPCVSFLAACTSVAFTLMCIGTLAPKINICASDKSWYLLKNPACSLGNKVAISETVALFAADITMIIIPLRLLYHVTLASNKQRMLILMFSANLTSTAFSIVHAVLLAESAWSLLAVISRAEVGISLISANIAVLTPYVYRMVRPESDFDSKPFTYYRSVQADGSVRLRRVSDLRVAPQVNLDDSHSPSAIEAPSLTTRPC